MTTYSYRAQRLGDTAFVKSLFAMEHARGFIHEETTAQIEAAMNRSGREGYIVCDGDEPVGYFVLFVHEKWFVEARLVVAARPRFGIGAYVLARIATRAFVDLGAYRVYLETTEDNVPMQGALARAGFVYEGTFRHGFRADDGTYKDLRAYGMLATDPAALSLRS